MFFPSERDQNKCLCVVIDDMDAFEVCAPTALRCRAFISRLIQSICRKRPRNSAGSMVSYVGRSGNGGSDSNVEEVGDSQSARSKINTIVAYGHMPPSHRQEHSNGSSFFSSALQMNYIGSGDSHYAPSLTEYCRYR